MSVRKSIISTIVVAGCLVGAAGIEVVAQKPAEPTLDRRVMRLIAHLGSASFARRQSASSELVRIGAPARNSLEEAKKSADRETQRRAEEILIRIEDAAARKLVQIGALVTRRNIDKRIIAVSFKDHDTTTVAKRQKLRQMLERLQRLNALPSSNVMEFDTYQISESFDESQLKIIADLRCLETLELEGSHFSDETMEYVSGLHSLTDLRIRNTRLRDDGCTHVASLINLRQLELDSVGVTDDALRHVSNARKLEAIALTNTKIQGQGFGYLAKLPLLTEMNFARSKILSSEFTAIGNLKSLSHLTLTGSNVTSSDLASLQPLRNLSFLRLDNTPITSIGVARLTPLSELTFLALSFTKIDDNAIPALLKLSKLKALDVQGCKVTEKGLALLKDAPVLTEINARETPVDMNHWENLRKHLKPKMLYLESGSKP